MSDDHVKFGRNVDRAVGLVERTRRRMVELSIPAGADATQLVERIGEEMAESERLRQAIRDRTEEAHVMGWPYAQEWLDWARDVLRG